MSGNTVYTKRWCLDIYMAVLMSKQSWNESVPIWKTLWKQFLYFLNKMFYIIAHHRNTYVYKFLLSNEFLIKKEGNLSWHCCKEGALIHEITTINLQPSFYDISPVLTKWILREYRILKNINNKKWKKIIF